MAIKEARLYDPRLFFLAEFTWTTELIRILGIINLTFASLVVGLFCMKRAPLLLKDIWIEWFEQKGKKI